MSIKAFTLDGFTKAAEEATKVIQLKNLEPNYTLAVVTQDEMEYDITVLEPHTGRVQVKGGIFTEPTECKLSGSTLGGSMLWTGRLVIGMCVEFWCNGATVTTPPVKIIGWRVDPSAPVSNSIQ